MDCFWPQTLMDYVSIVSACGTVLAFCIAMRLWVGTKQRMKIKKVSFEELITYSGKETVKYKEYKLNIWINNFFPSEIEIIGVMIASIDKDLNIVYQKLFRESHVLRPYYKGGFLVTLNPDAQHPGFYPEKCCGWIITKDHGCFDFKPDKTFVADYRAFLNNLDISKTIGYGSDGEFKATIIPPRALKRYMVKTKLKKYLLERVKIILKIK